MGLSDSTRNRIGRTISCTKRTALTLVSNDLILEQCLTYAGCTFAVINMVDIFILEELKGRKNRVRCCLTERTERGLLHMLCQFLDLLDIAVFALALSDLFQILQQSSGTDTARCTLTAALISWNRLPTGYRNQSGYQFVLPEYIRRKVRRSAQP